MKRQRLVLNGGMSVESSRDFNGRYWIAMRAGCSMFFRDPKEVQKFLKLPKGTDSRASFDAWLEELSKEKGAAQNPQSLPRSGSFDPLAQGIDAEDPNFQTRQII